MLLQKDYLVHEGAVTIISNYKTLRCSIDKEVNRNHIDEIRNLLDELSEHYLNHNVKPTNTLLSKILLGTLGCLPAVDRYFCDGVKAQDLDFRSLTKKSLHSLFNFLEDYRDELNEIQAMQSQPYYPNMKLIDMCFWQLCFDSNKIINKE